ncbi:unnamed protein product [Danaus chrysippus]|uniref:(African queen) hypothetical protein n=1 Tax=Danaus chrysippus TaxID=151541 RepID=A0A8J2QRA6_9NEOP|nr:unnamed protein product [Danaus chrysippus]
MTEHWSWLTGCGEAGEYTYSPPSRPSRPPHRPLVKVATSAHLHTIARPWIMRKCTPDTTTKKMIEKSHPTEELAGERQ